LSKTEGIAYKVEGVDHGPTRYVCRKLSYFQDKEGKTRTIGVLDYFSQSVLRPLHIYLEKVLMKIPQDCMLDQNKFKELAKD
jgi:predicted DsbA family dithiol-disulfide isomerase